MSEPHPPGKFTNFLLSALTAAFIAWAGTVWNTGEKIIALLSEIQSEQASQGAQMVELRRSLDRHEMLPWHLRAGEEISRLKGNNER